GAAEAAGVEVGGERAERLVHERRHAARLAEALDLCGRPPDLVEPERDAGDKLAPGLVRGARDERLDGGEHPVAVALAEGPLEDAPRVVALEELAERLEPELPRHEADDATDLGLSYGALNVRDGHAQEWSAGLCANATRELGERDRLDHEALVLSATSELSTSHDQNRTLVTLSPGS